MGFSKHLLMRGLIPLLVAGSIASCEKKGSSTQDDRNGSTEAGQSTDPEGGSDSAVGQISTFDQPYTLGANGGRVDVRGGTYDPGKGAIDLNIKNLRTPPDDVIGVLPGEFQAVGPVIQITSKYVSDQSAVTTVSKPLVVTGYLPKVSPSEIGDVVAAVITPDGRVYLYNRDALTLSNDPASTVTEAKLFTVHPNALVLFARIPGGVFTSVPGSATVFKNVEDSQGIAQDFAVELPAGSIILTGAAADGFLNLADMSSNDAIIQTPVLPAGSQTSHVSAPSSSACETQLGYAADPPSGSSFLGHADGSYQVCIKIMLPGGTTRFAKSPVFVVDKTPPAPVAIVSGGSGAHAGVGSVLSFRLKVSESVKHNASVLMRLNTGPDRFATSAATTQPNEVAFSYVVQPGDLAASFDYAATNALIVEPGMITDLAGNTLAGLLPAPGGTGSLAAAAAVHVSGVKPTISGSLAHARFAESVTYSPVATVTVQSTDGFGAAVTGWEYAVGTSAGLPANVKAWAAGASSSLTVTGLTLTSGSTYYLSVRAVDIYGNKSLPLTSAGWTVNTSGLTVQPLWPTNGAKWMDYVLDSTPTNRYTAPDTACDGSIPGYMGCIHGGEKRKVNVAALTSCTGLSFRDALGAFDWFCIDAGANVVLYSYGLKEGKGLADLLDVSGTVFKENHIILEGTAELTSIPAVWWSNTVLPLPQNGAGADPVLVLDSSDDGGNDDAFAQGTIFTVPSTRATNGVRLAMNKLALVALKDANGRYHQIGYAGNGAATCTGGEPCVVGTNAASYTWIEGRINCDINLGTIDWGVGIHQGRFNRVHGLQVANCVRSGLKTTSTAFDGLFTDVSVANTGQSGLDLQGERHGFSNLTIQAVGGYGVYGGFKTSFHDFLIVGASGGPGLTIAHGSASFGTVASGSSSGVNLQTWSPGSYKAVVHGLLAVNNANEGVDNSSEGGYSVTVSNLFSSENGVGYAQNYDFAKLAGQLVIGGTPVRCDADGNTNVGTLAEPTCTTTGTDGSSTYPGTSPSSAILYDRTSQGQFLGYVGATGDAVNQSEDASGQATAPTSGLAHASFDWFGFESRYRTWMRYTLDGFPTGNARGQWTAGTGAIYDWRPKIDANSTIFNRAADPVGGSPPFVDGANCPSAVDGSMAGNYTADYAVPPNTYLLFAKEVVRDSIGDDDGLCESNEHCIYAPNFGAYQGHGDFRTRRCTFQGGVITGVTMYAYPLNGG